MMAYSRFARWLFNNQYVRNYEANVQHQRAREHMSTRFKTFKSCRRSPHTHRQKNHRIVNTILTNNLLDLYVNKPLVKYYYLALYHIEGEVDILWVRLIQYN
jgi:hypothetical protein